ncbi:MAG: adenosylcobinamide-GDP ribazoletransferase [Johnsonella sp.]|nr:adenosylcobinamide-GDP ribazoletransferase [Johnsonella sp.]
MNILRSLIMVFGMYSKIPMPKIEWEEKNMKYMMMLFPLVGLFEGLLFFGLWKILFFFKISEYLRAGLITVFPLLYTGGIHMDGFLDTSDALGSHLGRERKLDILKDCHIGGSALTAALVYIILYYSAALSLKEEAQIIILSLIFIISRAYSALSVLCFRNARGEGSLMQLRNASERALSCAILILIILIFSLAAALYRPSIGIVSSISLYICFYYNRLFVCRQFGGITGDIAGFFLQLAELVGILAIALVS